MMTIFRRLLSAALLSAGRRRGGLTAAALAILLLVPARPAIGSPGGEAVWQAIGPDEAVRALAIDADGWALHALTEAGYRRWDGLDWTAPDPDSALNPPLIAHPAVPGHLYAAGPSAAAGPRRSIDGGTTWFDPAAGAWPAAFGRITALAVDPGDPDRILAGVAGTGNREGSLVRSTDGGRTWTEVAQIRSDPLGENIATEIAIAPSDPSVIYAGAIHYHGGAIRRSRDGGLTWQTLPGPADPLAYPGRIVVAPDDPARVLVASQGPQGSQVRIFRSVDGGATWTPTGSGLPDPAAGRRFAVALRSAPGWPDRAALAYADPSVGLRLTDDGGATWRTLAAPATADAVPTGIADLAFDATGGWIFLATDRGVWLAEWPAAPGGRAGSGCALRGGNGTGGPPAGRVRRPPHRPRCRRRRSRRGRPVDRTRRPGGRHPRKRGPRAFS